jgi:predicted MPP superfamily phosphohydrolase
MIASSFGLMCLLLGSFLLGNFGLSVSRYDLTLKGLPGSFSGTRIVQVSDLHDASFGLGNQRLLARINALKPDLVLVTGDLISSGDKDFSPALSLMAELAKQYTTCFSMGNHEQIHAWFMGDELPIFLAEMEAFGVHVLDNSRMEWKRGEDTVDITGYTSDLSFYSDADVLASSGISASDPSPLLKKLGKPSERIQLLMAHNPDYFESYASWGADVVFSGHMHGGVLRLPFIGGALSPSREWFPHFDAGMFRQGEAAMIVNRGLGNSIIPVRIFNPPDISLVTLHSEPAE